MFLYTPVWWCDWSYSRDVDSEGHRQVSDILTVNIKTWMTLHYITQFEKMGNESITDTFKHDILLTVDKALNKVQINFAIFPVARPVQHFINAAIVGVMTYTCMTPVRHLWDLWVGSTLIDSSLKLFESNCKTKYWKWSSRYECLQLNKKQLIDVYEYNLLNTPVDGFIQLT